MKIISIDLKDSNKLKGLKPIKMDRLKDVIILTGKNGSGKSRLLNILSENISNRFEGINGRNTKNIRHDDIRHFINEIKKTINILSSGKDIGVYLDNMMSDTFSINKADEVKKIIGRNIAPWAKNTLHLLDICTSIYTTPFLAKDVIIYIPKMTELSSHNNLTRYEMVGNAKDVKNIGLHSLLYLHDKVFSYIQILQEKRYNSSHPEIISSIEDKLIIEKDYHRLNQLFLHFFKAELKRDVEGNCTLYGQSIENVEFSEGQKILLQIIVAIHAQGGGINNYILILDEPENHLHPSAIIEILEILKANNTNGQIWIATHSIPILSHFGPEYIWYLEDGEVKHAGKVPQTVLEGLLGNEEEIEKLKDFVGLPELLALNTFAYECLLEPTVVTTEAGDPQTRQINTVLNSIIKNDGQEKLKVLDFGAGKGRLLSNLYEDMESAGQNLTDVLDYIAYDEYDADKTTCSDLIDKVYGSSDERYFNSIDKLISKQDKESFDVVILCNVLHEIEPQKWIELFSQKISKLLKENGVALIVEDTLMPVGEMAHSKGFIVLDTTQLKELFKVSSKEIDFVSNDAKGDDRLKAHYIGKRHLQNISTETLKESLKSAKKRASEKISKLRSSKEKSYKMGKAHAFYVQQYANADLALIELGG